MKNFKIFVIFELILLYFELLFKFINFGFSFNLTFLYTILFITILSLFLTTICSLFKPKTNKILSYVFLGIITLWFGIEIVFKQIFNTFFSLSVFTIADQATSFIGTAIQEIIKNIFYIILLLIPIILLIIFRKKVIFKKVNVLVSSIFFFVYILGTIFCLNFTSGEANELFYKVNNLDINLDRFGVLISTYLDFKKTVFGFEEDISIDDVNINKVDDDKNIESGEYGYNNLNYDFDKLYNDTKDKNIKSITQYVMNDTGTKKNEYTGLFEGKNLVFFMAESFNEIGVSEELTPTLYKLVNSGFVFENFYTPLNLSTIGGEYQDITGLMANSSILSTWRKGKNYYPYGLGNVFKNLGYTVNAYHNNSYRFQDRDKYLKAVGFDNYLGRYNGLEKRMKFPWPASDDDMVNVTIDDYIDSDKFMTYYVTVSGHYGYTPSESSMAKKNWDYVKDLPYSEATRGYLASQIELDKALASLIKKLEEKDKLKDTVIVLVADHYPYALSLSEINQVSSYEKDKIIEINRSNLILWNSELETTKISKVSSQIDVIPTVYNLFGIEYDSRLFVGKDILSTEPGLAMFSNRSWVSDKGKYFSSNKKFVPNDGEEVNDDYIKSMNNIVSNKLNISKLITSTNYYEATRNYLIKEEKNDILEDTEENIGE